MKYGNQKYGAIKGNPNSFSNTIKGFAQAATDGIASIGKKLKSTGFPSRGAGKALRNKIK